jgi:hypothetical protein
VNPGIRAYLDNLHAQLQPRPDPVAERETARAALIAALQAARAELEAELRAAGIDPGTKPDPMRVAQVEAELARALADRLPRGWP